MSEMDRDELLKAEAFGTEQGWVSPLSQEDKEYFAYLRKVFKRYNIVPSKSTRLEYDFESRVAESEFYLRQVFGPTHKLTHDRKNPGGANGGKTIRKPLSP